MKFWGTMISVLLLDQLTKAWVAGHFSLGESRGIIDGFLYLTYIRNPGASFGMLQGQNWLFLSLGALMIVALVYYQVKTPPQRWLEYSMGLMGAGTIGNMIDRIRFGAVQDFIDLGWWPVFNVADTAITIGGAILILYILVNELGQERD